VSALADTFFIYSKSSHYVVVYQQELFKMAGITG
jgi:hypothetical protein